MAELQISCVTCGFFGFVDSLLRGRREWVEGGAVRDGRRARMPRLPHRRGARNQAPDKSSRTDGYQRRSSESWPASITNVSSSHPAASTRGSNVGPHLEVGVAPGVHSHMSRAGIETRNRARTRTFSPVCRGRVRCCASLVVPAMLSAGPTSDHRPRHRGRHGPRGRGLARSAERLREEEPDRALDAIGIARGATIADVGAGSGYFTVRLARRVGPTGRVYANDVQREMLERLDRRLKADNMSNVTLVLGEEADPKLPTAALDLVLMVDVYHELAQPQAMLRQLRAALKPDGRLVLVEYRKEDPTVPIRVEHKMSERPRHSRSSRPKASELDTVLDVLPRQQSSCSRCDVRSDPVCFVIDAVAQCRRWPFELIRCGAGELAICRLPLACGHSGSACWTATTQSEAAETRCRLALTGGTRRDRAHSGDRSEGHRRRRLRLACARGAWAAPLRDDGRRRTSEWGAREPRRQRARSGHLRYRLPPGTGPGPRPRRACAPSRRAHRPHIG